MLPSDAPYRLLSQTDFIRHTTRTNKEYPCTHTGLLVTGCFSFFPS